MDCTPAGASDVKDAAKVTVAMFDPAGACCDPIAGMKLSSTASGRPRPATMVGLGGGVVSVGSPAKVSGVSAKLPSCSWPSSSSGLPLSKGSTELLLKFAPLACALPLPSPAAGKTD